MKYAAAYDIQLSVEVFSAVQKQNVGNETRDIGRAPHYTTHHVCLT